MKPAAKAMKAAKVMKAAMKAAKAMKVMKAMKAKKIGMGKLAKVLVFKGAREKTSGGLKAKDLTKNKKGKVVNKKRSAAMKNNAWNKACTARHEQGRRPSPRDPPPL